MCRAMAGTARQIRMWSGLTPALAAQMQARAGAIDELLASGALEDPTGTAKDDLTRELEALSSGSGCVAAVLADSSGA